MNRYTFTVEVIATIEAESESAARQFFIDRGVVGLMELDDEAWEGIMTIDECEVEEGVPMD